MKKIFYSFLAGLTLIVSVLACSLPPVGNNQSSGDQVSTIVAATLQALTPSAPKSGETPVAAPAGLLLRPLYFLNNDRSGNAQVYRLDTDGKTLHQVTFEPASVRSYDVSQTNGSVIYVSNHQLLLVNGDGSNRQVLLDGGPVDQTNPFGTTISNPVFSPNAQTIAYGYKGLNLYTVSGGTSSLVLTQEAGPGGGIPGKTYAPKKYSSDGGKLLISIIIPNSDGSSTGIYNAANNAVIPLTGDGARLCCSEQAWTSDGSGLFSASALFGFFASGMWKLDPATGNSTTLIPTEAGGGNYNLAAYPYLAPDDQLYYFFASQPAPDGIINDPPLQIVRSAADGVTGRTVLRPETFTNLNEALWSPDASFVLLQQSPDAPGYEGGAIELDYTDAARGNISLLPFAWQLKWGP